MQAGLCCLETNSWSGSRPCSISGKTQAGTWRWGWKLMMMKVINNWCLVPTSEFTARPRERGVQGWAGASDVRELERASRLAVCSAISCSNKTEVKTSAFRNSWDLTVSQMSLEGKQRCVMRKMSLHQGASASPPPPLCCSATRSRCLRLSFLLSTHTVSLPKPGVWWTWQKEVWGGCLGTGAFFCLLGHRKVHSGGRAGGGRAENTPRPHGSRSGGLLLPRWP